MAEYQKLLLSAGGGIVSLAQQAEQAENTATLLIGLGGTGVDCLRTIKTQVYSRLLPDDEKAVVPTYEHIRFLGVDSDKTTQGTQIARGETAKADALLPLLDSEYFSIANPNLKAALKAGGAIETRDELKWLRYKDIPSPNMTDVGAGGIRQVGRFMLMDRSSQFLAKLQAEINSAKNGLQSPTVNVHIFAGISGGTGAGTFLDVCYMVRHIANKVGGITIFGYFFLPDVNLSRIPDTQVQTRQFVPINGYASMQELDYCMNLQFNGGGFVQEYQGHQRVEWREPPVDLPHLICATDADDNVIPRAYEYAMGVTSEYVMDFLTKPKDEKVFGLARHLSNFQQEVTTADSGKVIGSQLSYCVIGASCASLPLRKINTYLASELFDKFSGVGANRPSQSDVEALVAAALVRNGSSFSQAYDSLCSEISAGAGTDFADYPDDWRFVRDYGNAQMVQHYTDQEAAKLDHVESNARSMCDEGNAESLMGRLRRELEGVIRDAGRGPVFAYGTLSAAASHNLLNVVDGLIAENKSRWDQEGDQSDLRQRDYDDARRDFEAKAGRPFGNERRFGTYKWYLVARVQHRLLMETYEIMDRTLRTLRKQAEEASAGYYLKLARVTQNLIETFRANRDALKSERLLEDDAFATPLMTVAELKGPMDALIGGIDVPNMFDQFMGTLIGNEDSWIREEENRIAKLVNEFFVKRAFEGFADRSINVFLKEKYGAQSDEELADDVYREWMKTLTAKAKPLFAYDASVWKPDASGSLAFISVPRDSAAITAAATRMSEQDHGWGVKASELKDRIYVMGSAAALPLAAYKHAAEYGRSAYNAPSAGMHYYETPGLEGMAFSDWRGLPPLTPQQLIDPDAAPPAVRKYVTSARDLFDRAYELGIIDEERRIRAIDPAYAGRVRAGTLRARQVADALERPDQVEGARAALDALDGLGEPSLVATGHRLAHDGLRDSEDRARRIAEDHFVSAPAYHQEVLDTMEEADGPRSGIEDARASLKERIDEVERG